MKYIAFLILFAFSQQSSASLLFTLKGLEHTPTVNMFAKEGMRAAKGEATLKNKFKMFAKGGLKAAAKGAVGVEVGRYLLFLPYLFWERGLEQAQQEANVHQEAYIQRLWGYYIFDEDLFSRADAVLEQARLLANRIAYEKFGVRRKSKDGGNIYYGIPKGHIKLNTRYHIEAKRFDGKGYYLIPADFLVLENNVENIAWALLDLIIRDQLKNSVVIEHYDLDMYGRKNSWLNGAPTLNYANQNLSEDTDGDGVREYNEGVLHMADYRMKYVASIMERDEADSPTLPKLNAAFNEYQEKTWTYGVSYEKQMRAFKQFYMVDGAISYRFVESHLQKPFQDNELSVPCGVPQAEYLFLGLDRCQYLPVSENLQAFINWTAQEIEKMDSKIGRNKGLAFANSVASFVLASFIVSKIPFVRVLNNKAKGLRQALRGHRFGKATKSFLLKGASGTVFFGSAIAATVAIEVPGLELLLLREGQLEDNRAFYGEMRTIFEIVQNMDLEKEAEEYLLDEMQRVMQQFGAKTTRFIKNVSY